MTSRRVATIYDTHVLRVLWEYSGDWLPQEGGREFNRLVLEWIGGLDAVV